MASQLTINIRTAIASLIGRKMARARLRLEYAQQFRVHHPAIRYETDWRKRSVQGVSNESGMVLGSVVGVLKSLTGRKNRVLLAGENADARAIYSGIIGIPESAITIAGLDETSDMQWNFEQSPPKMDAFDIIVSHAIIEHLIDPYKHICDLISLLAQGGSLVVYTVMPGFQYHRHPVDCQRFFPDWFVEIAKRTNTTINDMCISEEHIVVTFGK